MWLALLKNPLTKIIAEKTFGAISHKLQKDKILNYLYKVLHFSFQSFKKTLKGPSQPELIK